MKIWKNVPKYGDYRGYSPAARAVAAWHIESRHAGAFEFCSHEPCASVRAADR